MTLAEMVKKSREIAKMSRAELADKIGVPEIIIACIEQPDTQDEKAVSFFAAAFGLKPEVFSGTAPREPSEGEKRAAREAEMAARTAKAKYPSIRAFILDPCRCADPAKALELFGEEPFSLAERNVVLYLSTTALYNFCDNNSSSFAFDSYLFKHHGKLLQRFEQETARLNLPAEQREERINMARGDIFRCGRIEDIAILVLDDFAAELEEKLKKGADDFMQDLALPFTWEIDAALMKITIKDSRGGVAHQIRLLDVKGRS